MALARITLAGAGTYTRETPTLTNRVSRLIWEWDRGYPAIPSAVSRSGNNRIEQVEINRSGSEAYFELATTGGDLRNRMERDGQVWLEFASRILHLPELIQFAGSGYDSSEPYLWAVGDHHAIDNMVADAPAADDGTAVLTLWDGVGANPFDHDKLKLGGRDIVRTYIGSRLRVREYVGAAQVN